MHVNLTSLIADPAFYEQLLRKSENDSSLAITSIDEEAAIGNGENFASVVIKLIVKGKTGNGSPFLKSIIVKRQLDNEKLNKAFESDKIFRNEAVAYEIFKALPINLEHLIPKCLYADYKQIIMEDLKSQGFVMMDRMSGLDLEHAKLVLEGIADIHAASLLMQHNDKEKFDELKRDLREMLMGEIGTVVFEHIIEGLLQLAIIYMKRDSAPREKWTKAIATIESYFGKCKYILQDQVKPNGYSVICPGDLWTNNILFKYEKQNKEKKVTEVRFLDFQLARYSSFAIDLLYFFHSSMPHKLFIENEHTLVSIYHARLSSHLPDKITKKLTLDYVKRMMSEHKLYGFLMTICLSLTSTVESDKMPNLAERQKHASVPSTVLEYWSSLDIPEYEQRVKDKCEHFLLSD